MSQTTEVRNEFYGGLVAGVFLGLFRSLFWIVRRAAVSLGWGVVAFLLLQFPSPWGIISVAVLVAGAVGLWFVPEGRARVFVPLLGDWGRWRVRRVAHRQQRDGYAVGRDLGVLPIYSAEEEQERVRKGGKRLPDASYFVADRVGYFRAQQLEPRTDEQILQAAEALAPTLGFPAEFVRLERPTSSEVLVTWRPDSGQDVLDTGLPFRADEAMVAGEPVLIGITDSSTPFRLNIFDRQTLVLGASGSGKGSVLWSAMLGLAPEIHKGAVRVTGVDLKGGIELMPGRALFDAVAITFEEAAAAIRSLAEEVDRRLEHMRSVGSRKHVPTVAEPALLLLVDEYASLVYTAPDTKSRNAVEADLKRILSTGRAARINVLALAQDPRAESILARSLFTNVVALRFRTIDDARLALGAAAVEAGAQAHKIKQSQPGTGFVIDSDGSGEPVRFRAFWCDDVLIGQISARYGVGRVVDDGETSQ